MSTVSSLPQRLHANPACLGRSAEIVAFPSRSSRPKLRILHISLSSRVAGSERYCVDLANQQARMGHEVHVAALPGSTLAEGLAPDVTFHPVRLPFLWSLELERIVGRMNADVCHAHLGRACKALARVRTKARKVATLHVGYKPHQHGKLDGLICVNNTQTWRLGGYDGAARVISNWLPTTPDTPRVNLRAELGLAADTLVVGSVGRLHPSKGCDVLIQAFRDVAPPHAALVLLGDGPQRKALEKLCAGDHRIHFLGFRNDVAAVIDNFDLFVSPSREESFGLAILEAMKAGLPVIATDTDGPGDYLRSQPATLIETGSIGALGQAIARQIYRPDPAPRYDLRPFEPALNVGKIVDFYRDLGAGPPRAETPAGFAPMLDHASSAQD